MANTKITALTPDTTPTSDDLVATVNDPAGTPANRKVTAGNLITKAHGLSDGVVKVATGAMTNATQGTDYYAPSGTDVAVADGGTGASDAATARTNLGLAIGTDVQGYDADLAAIAGLSGVEGDIIYRDASQWQRLAKGTASQLLRINAGATAPEWATISSSGQSTFDAIVAPSGGDYATLGAAIAAASNGWSIFVKEGTYTESAITTSLTNLKIVGESRETAILSHSTNALAFSGVGVQFENIQFTMTTGRVTISGAGSSMRNCKHISSGAISQPTLNATGASQLYLGNWFESTSTASRSDDLIYSSGNFNKFAYNHFKTNSLGSSTNHASIEVSGTGSQVIGNVFEAYASGEGSGCVVRSSAVQSVIAENVFNSWTNTTTMLIVISGGTSVIKGNVTYGSKRAVSLESANNLVTGNSFLNILGSTGYGVYDATGSNIITGNHFKAGTGTTRGVTMNGVARCTVTNNYFDGLGSCIEIVTGSTDYIVSGNRIYNSANPFLNSGTTSTGTCFDNSGVQSIDDRKSFSMSNSTGSTINAGDVVIWNATATGNEVARTTTAGDSKVFGVAQAAITTGSSGLIQTTGKTVLLKVDGTTDIAIGDFLSTFTTAGIAAKASAGQTAFAIALEAYTTNDSLGVIDALIITPRLI